jgi:HlyD family secretion protein
MCKLREAQQNAKFKEGALIEQELQGVREPWAKNLIQLNRLTSLEREQARLQGERGQLIAEAKGKIAEIELQVLQVDHEFSSEVANNCAKPTARSANTSSAR